MEKIDL